ncbi:ATP synthase F0 subunit A [Bacteriovorax stolpii]|uniref:ATP synthase subunit a n=1 Tax=Bacteriovorax stolpii TaxID=960 RepID=A0A2K9NNA6_BACTC|nr:F0F1 ATP synthase subunit A [Bacteriovorax stolpii]AUN96525.1 ATP synthase F0 subunit A [Bacteriovorax stolpii]TDP53954.1 ATP synthase F0 subcomplex A subunit [Bacteriovorax stolpii]
MRKISLVSLLALLSSNAHASGGFTWVTQFGHATGLDHFFEHLTGVHHYDHILTFILVLLALVLTGVYYRAKTKNLDAAVVPDKGITYRNIVELYGSFIYTQARAVLGEKDAPKYYSFVATMFLVIFVSNMVGLIPGFLPPTESINTTLAVGVFSFLYFNFKGCKELGTINYLKHFAGPLWYMAILIFPIEIISTCIRPISLALRLYGNMYGDHMVLGTFSNLAPLLVPIVFMVLGILVSFIQAYVFTMLSMVYISLATAHHDHGDHHAHH